MNEFEFIKQLSINFNNDTSGIGDDAALIENNLLIAKDILVENIHFLPTTPIHHVINKLFSSNISDIAAMGGTAKYALLGIATDDSFKLDKILASLEYVLSRYNIKLIGGDTSRSVSGLYLSLTVIGEASKNVLKRSGATPGDVILLSRPIGKAKISLETEVGTSIFNCDPYYHYTLEAEDELGKILGNIPEITSCIDISDGLGIDASHIAKMSGVKVIIQDQYLPYQTLSQFHINKQDYILSSGEEFALLFTIPKNILQDVIYKITSELEKNSIILIGQIKSGSGTFLQCENGMLKNISNYGYEHFNKSR